MTSVDVMAKCTARILAGSETEASSIGSGFFYGFPPPDGSASQTIPTLVTNKHVLNGCTKATIVLSVAPAGSTADVLGRPVGMVNETFDIPVNAQVRIDHPSADVDLCCLLVGPIFNDLRERGKAAHAFLLSQSFRLSPEMKGILRAVEPIVMVGYPNGLWDETNNAPIVRRGITATHPLLPYGGKTEFLIDAASFPGSSGSPVFLYEDGMYRSAANTLTPGTKIALLGVLWGGPQFDARGTMVPTPIPHGSTHLPLTQIPMNLGIVIAADELDALGAVIHGRMTSEAV